MSDENIATLLVELTVTKSLAQYLRVLEHLRRLGWKITSTPRHAEFGLTEERSVRGVTV